MLISTPHQIWRLRLSIFMTSPFVVAVMLDLVGKLSGMWIFWQAIRRYSLDTQRGPESLQGFGRSSHPRCGANFDQDVMTSFGCTGITTLRIFWRFWRPRAGACQ